MRYNDIIDLPHHVSPARKRMSNIDRAAQFSPFAALTGHDAAIRETGRLTDAKTEHGEEIQDCLNRQYALLKEHLSSHPAVTVIYFIPDDKKAGGRYAVVSDKLKKIDEYKHLLILLDGRKIPMEDVAEIDSEVFRRI